MTIYFKIVQVRSRPRLPYKLLYSELEQVYEIAYGDHCAFPYDCRAPTTFPLSSMESHGTCHVPHQAHSWPLHHDRR